MLAAKLKDFDRTDHGWPDFVRVHPILDWDYATIWHFLREPSLTLGQGHIEWCDMYNYGSVVTTYLISTSLRICGTLVVGSMLRSER